MILRRFLHTDPVGISHLLGCGGRATGAVMEPVAGIPPAPPEAASLRAVNSGRGSAAV